MDYRKNTNVFGINVPNIVLYGLLICIVLFFLGVFKAIKNFVSALFNKLGLSDSNADQTAANDLEILKKIEKVPGVSSQVTAVNKDKAEALFKAMDGLGTDTKTINSIFESITGPNQMGAIYKLFGRRQLNAMSWFAAGPAYPIALGANLFGGFSGTLTECLKNELSATEINKNLGTTTLRWSIQTKLNWLNDFK